MSTCPGSGRSSRIHHLVQMGTDELLALSWPTNCWYLVAFNQYEHCINFINMYTYETTGLDASRSNEFDQCPQALAWDPLWSSDSPDHCVLALWNPPKELSLFCYYNRLKFKQTSYFIFDSCFFIHRCMIEYFFICSCIFNFLVI